MTTDLELAATPPHDLAAEKVALGAMMTDPAQVDAISDLLTPEDHYRGVHQDIHAAIIRLRDAREPTDPVAVLDELRRAGLVTESLNGPYLHSLTALVPVAAQGVHYARIVAKHALTRRTQAGLISGLGITRTPGFNPYEDMDAVRHAVDQATGDLPTGSDTAEWLGTAAWDVLSEVEQPLPVDGISPPYRALGQLMPVLRPGWLVTIAARPAIGKTTVLGDFARHTGLKLGLPVAWFTLEMTRAEVIMRLFAAEARVPQHNIANHCVTEAEWLRLADAAKNFGDSKILIDEKSAATMAHIRAGLRRMSRVAAPRMIIVDYLQLAEAPGAASRQEEIARLTRGLKELAKEWNVPVVMAAQLNRNPEMRQDKRPVLSDLRECLTGDTVLTDPVTGVRQTMAEAYATGAPVRVLAMDSRYRLGVEQASTVVASGVKPVYRLRTATGREIRASANHPFRTFSGWTQLCDLQKGDDIAVPRRLPPITRPTRGVSSEQARFLGYLISDGSYSRHRSVAFTNRDSLVMADAVRIAETRFGVRAREKNHWSGTPSVEFSGPGTGPGSNPLINWLKLLGIHGHKGQHKVIPRAVFACDADVAAECIAGLWAGDGSIARMPARWAIKYVSTSRELLHQIQHLLTRIGIRGIIGPPTRHTKSTMDIAEIRIDGSTEVCRFGASVPLIGYKAARLALATGWAAQCKVNSTDTFPNAVLDLVWEAKARDGRTWNQLERRCCQPTKRPSRADLARFAELTGDQEIADLANGDIRWDRIVSIEPDGEEMTYDLVVPDSHNFVANDIIVHNSGEIENSSDVVILLHREDAYEQESPRAGEMDLLVVKHRHGATATITVAAQLWYCRCLCMSPDTPPPAQEPEPVKTWTPSSVLEAS